MFNRTRIARAIVASLIIITISAITFASPWTQALSLLGFASAESSPNIVEAAPDTYFAAGTCDAVPAGNVEVEGTILGTTPVAYATLKAAFDAINAGTHTGAVTIDVCGNTTETASAVLNASGSGSSSYTSVVIAPVGGARTISGSMLGAMIDLNGADNVTINGVNSGGTSLELDNQNTGNSFTVRFIGDASNNTIQNSTIRGANSASTTNGVILFSTGTTTGNDNNTISNNNITSSVGGNPQNAIYSGGTSAAIDNSGNTITGNNISDYFNAAAATSGISLGATGNSAWTITNNKLYQTVTRVYTTAATHNGINIAVGSGYTISGNIIGFANPSSTGTTNLVGNTVALTGTFPSAYSTTGTANATRYIAINAAFTAGGTVSEIHNNTIGGFALYTSSGATTTNGILCGIAVTSGNANIGTTTGNTIGTAAGSMYAASTTGGALIVGIYATSTNTITIQNNTIQNFDAMGTTATSSGSVNGINTAGSAGNFVVSGNTVGGSSNPSFRMGTLTTGATLSNIGTTFGAGTGASIFQGILNSATGTVTIGSAALPNIIRNASANSTSTSARVSGIQTSAGTNTVDSNSIYNLTTPSGNTSASSSPAVVGIHLSISGLTHSITRNTIRDLSSTAASAAVYVDGIYVGSTPGLTISKNSIYNLTTASTSTTSSINGILLFNSSATINIYNNMMRLGLGVGNNPIIRGVYDNTVTSSPTNIFHNSIYIDGTQGAATVNTACISKVVSSTMDVKNNILWNNRASTGSPGAGTGRHYGIQVTSGTVTSNYNDIYTPGLGGAVGFATSDRITLANWQSAASQDLNSQNSNPQFQDPTNPTTPDLHINPSITTLVEGNGTLLANPTDDFDGQTRSSLTPVDIGADAGNFTGVDLTAPVIAYTALGNTTLTIDRTLTITVTDASGVPTSGVGLPVIYYRKNAGSYVNTQCVFVSGSTYTCNISATSLGGLVATDTVSYYVAAQDSATTPNVTTNPFTGASGFTASPPAASTPPTTPNSYLIASPITGTKTVCASGCDYKNLTGAAPDGVFAALNAGVLTGNVSIELADNFISEPGTNGINQLAEEPSGSNFAVKIYPTGSARTISGAVASGALIKLNGADRVTIDGSIGGVGTDRSLTITNTSTTSPTSISIISLGTGAGATNNTIKNTNISTGVSAATGYGISVGGSTPGTSGADNDNTTIQNNAITVATVGIYANGTASVSTGGNDSLAITDNTIDSNTTIQNQGIQVGNATGSSITGNTVSVQSSGAVQPTAISLETGFVSSTVIGNKVTKALATNTSGYGGRGITIGTGTATSALTIANNVVYGVNGSNWNTFSGSSSFGIGIGVLGGGSLTTTTGGVNLYYNSVSMTGSMGSASTTALTTALYVGSGASALDIRNNVLANTQVGTNASQKNYAIYSAVANTAYSTINYNDYFVSNTFNAGSAIPGYIGSDRLDLSAIQTGFGQNANSITSNPLFNNPLSNLQPQTGSPLLLAGTPIGSITTDILGATRNVTTPTIGAYEAAVDTAGPAITYTAFIDTTSAGDRVLSTTITDPAGVPTTGVGLPVIYYRKNLGAWASTQCSYVSGDNYDCSVVAAAVGGVAAGDSIQYYVAAQDNLANVSVQQAAGASGLTPNPPAAATPPTTPNSYLILTVINSFPYSNDFETNNGGWTAGFTAGSATDWVYGTPAKTQITGAHGGTRAWVTKLTGTYTTSTTSTLTSPTIDMSSITGRPTFSFWSNFKTEAGWDAGILEYSTDGGSTWTKVDANLGTGGTFDTTDSSGWYNSSSTSGPISQPKWSGTSTVYTGAAVGWIQSTTLLPAAVIGQANVRLRYTFGSDSSTNDEGWAIDDISITTPVIAPGNLQLSAATYSGNENTTVPVVINRVSGSAGAVSVELNLTDGTATGAIVCGPGIDFQNYGGPNLVTFADGETTKTRNVTLCPDAVIDPGETFTATLSNYTGGAGAGTPTTATITIGDVAPPLSGTFNVPGDYPSLTNNDGIFKALNDSGASGNIVINIAADLTGETGTHALNAIASPYTVRISPTGSARVVSGAAASTALIRTNGASRVTIDGSLGGGGTDRSLTIENTSVTTPQVVRFGSIGATAITANTLKNVVAINGVNTSSAVVVTDDAGTAGTFDNITIQNNDIQRAFVGIYTNATVGAGNGANLLITQNKLDTSGANAIRNIGIYVQGADGATVSSNSIGNFNTTNGEDDFGIWFASGTINSTMSSNSVTALGMTAASVAFGPVGLADTSSAVSSGNNIIGNTVSNISTGSSASDSVTGILIASGGTTVQRNTVADVNNTSTGTYGAFGIDIASGNNVILRNNFISGVTGNMQGGFAFSTNFGIFGIRVNAGTGHQIQHNSVNMFGARAGAASTSLLTSALCLATATSTGMDIRNNIFANTITGGTTSIANVSVYLPSTGTSAMNLTMNNNDYFFGTDVARQGAGQAGTTAGTNFFTTLSALAAYSSTLHVPATNDNSSQDVDPLFVSATDLHLQLASSLLGLGTPIGSVTVDYDNDPRPASAPDIGADEIVQSVGGVMPSGTFYNASYYLGDTLSGDVSVTNTLYLLGVTSGAGYTTTVGCNATVVGAGSSSYIDGAVKKDFCATGSFDFPVGQTQYSKVGVNVTALGTNPSSLTVTPYAAPLGGFPPATSLSRNWNLEETGDLTADLLFYYDDADVNGTESDYRAYKRAGNGVVTDMCGGPCVDTVNNIIGPVSGVSSFSRWTGAGPLAPTAADVSLSGRVTTADGRGVTNAVIVLTGNALAQPMMVKTGSFGYYRFDNLEAGETYIVTVNSKRFIFSVPSRVVSVPDNVSNIDFVAMPE